MKTLKKNSKIMNGLLLGAMAALVVAAPSVGSPRAAAQNDSNRTVKVPQTAQEHYALADRYQKEATELRVEIEQHNQMLAEYSKGVATNPKATGENGYVKNMRLHCEKYIKAAESLMAEDNELAKFHTLRAKELEGK